MNHWRDHLIREAMRRGVTQVELPIRDFAATYLTNGPRMYFFCDVTEDPTFWTNRFVAWYYGVNSIRRVPPAAGMASRPERRQEIVGLKPDRTPIRNAGLRQLDR